jgi:hypothetical protein
MPLRSIFALQADLFQTNRSTESGGGPTLMQYSLSTRVPTPESEAGTPGPSEVKSDTLKRISYRLKRDWRRWNLISERTPKSC